ncbi:TetR/AcrR family transcriptional regulator [Algoriphagus sp. CAU 1675]|uniref:TetR/AcrR family transcriptional regulator n=1 Tax=Algoriphagus sp. CAU 1675 TaxID=3032597 RepID=UPI0023DB92A0|nr:TetR/AcrR family transcriptional regulator [Algoriphagus sp. CAU 1675]MDF2157078.1 TetR/AcrR family transcriptional regulator [Algoriphagus sp. CAU 1675]
MREKILEFAIGQFSTYGIRNVTMDDVARQLGISKKTLYQEFKDKKELLKETFEKKLQKDQEDMSFLIESEDGVIEHLVNLSKYMRESLSKINPIAILEIQKYFPDVWEIFERHKEGIIQKDLVFILEKGKTLGYFRSEIDSNILARLRVEQITSAFDPSNFQRNDFNLVDFQMQMLDHFLHGIFTEKGRQAYQTQKETQERTAS